MMTAPRPPSTLSTTFLRVSANKVGPLYQGSGAAGAGGRAHGPVVATIDHAVLERIAHATEAGHEAARQARAGAVVDEQAVLAHLDRIPEHVRLGLAAAA